MSNGFIIPGQKATPTTTPQGVDPTELRLLNEEMRTAHREKKRAAVLALESIIAHIKEGDRPEAMQPVITTIKSHPEDFQLRELKNVEVHMFVVAPGIELDAQQRPAADLVLYWPLDRQVAFGSWTGRYVQQGYPSSCITMRPQRFVDVMIPDGAYADPNVGEAFETMRQIARLLSGLPQAAPVS